MTREVSTIFQLQLAMHVPSEIMNQQNKWKRN